MGSNKWLMIGLGVAAAVAALYFFFLRGDDTGPLLETVTGGTGMSASAEADRELIQLLQELSSITLDPTLFDNPVFRSLEDFRVTPAAQPVGRPNPFAPAGGQ